jgi:hypothetical protein
VLFSIAPAFDLDEEPALTVVGAGLKTTSG